ncbi:hypothetical protein [Fervidobacterium sp.]
MVIKKEFAHSCSQEKLLRLIESEAEPYIRKYNVKLRRIDEYIFEGRVGFMGKGVVEITPEKLIISIDSTFLGMPGAKEKAEEMIEKYAMGIIEECKKRG